MPNNLVSAVAEQYAKREKISVKDATKAVEKVWDIALDAKPGRFAYANAAICDAFNYKKMNEASNEDEHKIIRDLKDVLIQYSSASKHNNITTYECGDSKIIITGSNYLIMMNNNIRKYRSTDSTDIQLIIDIFDDLTENDVSGNKQIVTDYLKNPNKPNHALSTAGKAINKSATVHNPMFGINEASEDDTFLFDLADAIVDEFKTVEINEVPGQKNIISLAKLKQEKKDGAVNRAIVDMIEFAVDDIKNDNLKIDAEDYIDNISNMKKLVKAVYDAIVPYNEADNNYLSNVYNEIMKNII